MQNIVEFHIIGRLGRIDPAKNVTPAAFAAELKKQGAASLRIAGGYATQPLASPAPTRNNDAEALIATG